MRSPLYPPTGLYYNPVTLLAQVGRHDEIPVGSLWVGCRQDEIPATEETLEATEESLEAREETLEMDDDIPLIPNV